MDSNPSDSANANQTAQDAKTRQRLAVWVAFGGMGAVAALGIVSIFRNQVNAKDILTMVLPVIGTWVGTVLAFYFAKDNLLAATQSTKELLGLTERLKKIPVDSAMLRFGDPKVLKKQLAAGEDPRSLKLLDLAKLLRDAGRNRLPVLNADGAAVYIIHLSTLTNYISQRMAQPASGAKPVAELTIQDMEKDTPKLFSAIQGFDFVKKTASLAEAKAVLESKLKSNPDVADIFVTENGGKDEPVIGWVTNVEIGLRSQA